MRPVVLTALLLIVPRVALACPVCAGQTDAPLARATTLGVGVMLGVVALVIGGVTALFVRLRRHALATTGSQC